MSTANWREAGVSSISPAPSFARTSIVCWPAASPVRLSGDSHAAQPPVSSRHSKPAPGSFEENENVGSGPVKPEGPESTWVSGALVSTVNDRWAGLASTFPRASVARTSNKCADSLRLEYALGDPQL